MLPFTIDAWGHIWTFAWLDFADTVESIEFANLNEWHYMILGIWKIMSIHKIL